MIVCNLFFVGVKVNELIKYCQIVFYFVVQQDLFIICLVFLENGVDFVVVDENGNNVFYFVVMYGWFNNIWVFLIECIVDVEVFNF